MSTRLASERVVVAAPMSFAGSAGRIWKMTDNDNAVAKAGLIAVALCLVSLAWIVVAVWYFIFGLLLVPYRLIRRGSRKRKVEALRHREQLQSMATVQQQQQTQTALLAQQQTAILAAQNRNLGLPSTSERTEFPVGELGPEVQP